MATKNLFAVLDSDDEDTPVVKQQASVKEQPAKPVKTVKPNAKKQEAKKQGGEEKKRDNRPRSEGQNQRNNKPRGERSYQRPERERGERPDRSHHTHHGERDGERPQGSRPPRRTFERRSGTGRGKETSKHGGGARNWGNETDKTELVAEAAVQEGEAATEEQTEETPVEEAPVEEEEDNEMTLDEYLAKKKETRTGAIFEAKEVRQVENSFTDAAVITKEGKTPDFIEASYEKVFTKKTSGRKKNVVTDVGFQSAPLFERRDNRGRGDEGRGRGGRGRGGRRSNAPNVADLNAFPSLS